MAAPMNNLKVVLFHRLLGTARSNLRMRGFSNSVKYLASENMESFDTEMLRILVCPISKQPLRYDPDKEELISDAINVAYPIKNGIPNLVPTDGRILKDDPETGSQSDEGTPV